MKYRFRHTFRMITWSSTTETDIEAKTFPDALRSFALQLAKQPPQKVGGREDAGIHEMTLRITEQ